MTSNDNEYRRLGPYEPNAFQARRRAARADTKRQEAEPARRPIHFGGPVRRRKELLLLSAVLVIIGVAVLVLLKA